MTGMRQINYSESGDRFSAQKCIITILGKSPAAVQIQMQDLSSSRYYTYMKNMLTTVDYILSQIHLIGNC